MPFIQYSLEGEVCGIFNGGQEHRVCIDGLTCTQYILDDTSGTISKKCLMTRRAPGDPCNDQYLQCGAGLDCLANEWEELTCGGTTGWSGNDASILNTRVAISHYQISYTMIFSGVCILLVDVLVVSRRWLFAVS